MREETGKMKNHTSSRIIERCEKRTAKKSLHIIIPPWEQSARDLVLANQIRLKEEYGFFANRNITPNQNAINIVNENPTWFCSDLSTNLTYHNLCTYLTPPPCLEII